MCFYFEKSKVNDNDTTNPMVSIRIIDPNNIMYLAFENKIVKAYTNLTNDSLKSNMSFITHRKPFKYIIKIITIFNGSVKTMKGDNELIGVIENNIEGDIIECGVILIK